MQEGSKRGRGRPPKLTQENAVSFLRDSRLMTRKELAKKYNYSPGYVFRALVRACKITGEDIEDYKMPKPGENITTCDEYEHLEFIVESCGLTGACRVLGVAKSSLFKFLNKKGISTHRDEIKYPIDLTERIMNMGAGEARKEWEEIDKV